MKRILLVLFISLTATFQLDASSLLLEDNENSDEVAVEKAPENLLKSRSDASSPYFLISVYAFLFIAGGIAFYVLYKKKMLSGFSGLNSNKNIRVIETSMLGNRQFLVLAECMNRKVLLGVGPGFITKLSEFGSDHSEFENSFNKELQDLEKSE